LSPLIRLHFFLTVYLTSNIWGWAAPASTITASLRHANTTTVAAPTTGFWNVSLPPQPASFTSHTITITDTHTAILLKDILFGEVLLFSGQSNMEFVLPAVVNASVEIATADHYPYLRFFSGTQQNVDALVNSSIDFTQPSDELAYVHLNWTVSASNVVGGCNDPNGCDTCCQNPMPASDPQGSFVSAVAFLTARHLFQQLNLPNDNDSVSIPIGAVVQSYGGTSIQYWMSKQALGKVQGGAPPGTQCCGENGPDSCLWNTQLHPYTLGGGMKFSSVVWYQGEQNANCG
jgi:hypothetical protein